MTTSFLALGAATTVATADALSVAPIDIWEKFGIVGFLILVTITLYRDWRKREEKMSELHERTVMALQHVADVIGRCEGHGGFNQHSNSGDSK